MVSGHGEAAKRYQVQIDGSEVTCHDEIVSVRAKNTAPARWPPTRRRLCLSGRISHVAENQIEHCEFSLIDFKG